MKKKCLLISPPNTKNCLPRGLTEIASFLESKGCSTEVLPLAYYLGHYDSSNIITSYSDDEKQTTAILEETIKKTKPIVIGLTNQFTKDYPACLKILEICKAINKEIITVIGGPHVTFQDLNCIGSQFVDVVVRGEGEWTLLDLLSAVEKGKDLENVKGITFKRNGKALRTPDRPLGDLSELPPINFGLLPYKFVQNSFIAGMLNRGCVHKCAFCVERVFWKKRRFFPVQRLISEMKTLETKYNNRMYAIEDSMLYFGSPQFFELCLEISRHRIDLPYYFYIQCRVDQITDSGIKASKKANINNVWMGIESASPKVLKVMCKNITIEQTIAACQKLRKNKLNALSFWMIGHPGDDPKESRYSLKMLKYLADKELVQKAEVALFLPYPGTPFFHQPEKYGIEILSFDWSQWERWCDKPVSQLKNFSAEQITLAYQDFLKIQHQYNLLAPQF